MKSQDRFQIGRGCFKCESCGRLTRGVPDMDLPYCKECEAMQEQENVILDHKENDILPNKSR